MPESKPKSFRAVVQPSKSPLHWAHVRVPFSVEKLWGTRAAVRVKVEVNGEQFSRSLLPDGNGGHFFVVGRAQQCQIGVAPGETAKFTITRDETERPVVVPKELQKYFREDAAMRKWFGALNDSTRRWICGWVVEPKSAAARERRAEQLAERLLNTMEAEIELPPRIRAAFARNPKAWDGWQLMTAAARRAQLLGIFYYRTPESQERRIEKAMEEAEKVAEKKSSSLSG